MRRRFLYFLTFVTGASVLMIELTASRLLAPFFGTSIFVWANVIGVVLVALSLGYWVGGKLADRRPDPKILLTIILFAGLFTSTIPLAADSVVTVILKGVGSFNLTIIVGSFFSVFFLFGFPLFLLGMASPFTVRILTEGVGSTGNTAGSVFAFSTIGSIVGTFGSAFLTVPFWGTRQTFFLASFLLVSVSAVGLVKPRWVLLLIGIPIGLSLTAGAHRTFANVIESRESVYQYLEVDDEGNGIRTLRINDGIGIQSTYDPKRIRLGSVNDYFPLLAYLRPDKHFQRVVNLGHAAGEITRHFDTLVRKDFALEITGVEIDPVASELGRRYFKLDEQDISVVNADGREFLRRNEETFDVIIVDTYSQQIYIPFHMTTREFFLLGRSHLAADGIMSMNVNAVRPDAPLLSAILTTMESVFPFTYALHVPESYNYFVFGSAVPFDFERFRKDISSTPYADIGLGLPEAAFQPSIRGQTLTDNRAPVELMTEKMIFALIGRHRLEEILESYRR